MAQIAENWQLQFIRFIIFGILIFSLFRILRYFLPYLIKSKRSELRMKQVLPLSETIVWLLFMSVYIVRFYAQQNIYAIIILFVLLIIIFWISRFMIKDMIAGLIFRISGKLKEDDIIKTDEISGTIKKFRFDCLEIESKEGQLVFIPYSQIAGNAIYKNESAGQSSAYVFHLICSDKNDIEKLSVEIKNYILSLPWSSITNKPQVNLAEHTNAQYKLEIGCYPVDKAYAKKIEKWVLEKFQD